jgi:hypothetical protein
LAFISLCVVWYEACIAAIYRAGVRRVVRKLYIKWKGRYVKDDALDNLLEKDQNEQSLEQILRKNVITTIINGINESVNFTEFSEII